MGWKDREPGAELQAKEAEIDDLKVQVERNRSESADRTRKGKKPQRSEGRDGDNRYVDMGGTMYMYSKTGGKWYRVALEEV